MRKRTSVLLILLCTLLFAWQGIAAFAFKGVSQLLGYQLTFNEIRLSSKGPCLLNASFSNQHFQLTADEIGLFPLWQRPLSLQVEFKNPHLHLCDTFSYQPFSKHSSKWIRLLLKAEEGIVHWGDLEGHFSLEPHKLRLEVQGGTLIAERLGSGKFDCRLFEFEIAPFAKHLSVEAFTQPKQETLLEPSARGRLSGSLLLSAEQVVGQLCLKEAISPWGGADRLDWEGEILFPRGIKRMKLSASGAFAKKGKSHLEGIEAICSFNEGVGWRWEVTGNEFTWEGKSFSSKWIESDLKWQQAHLHLFYEDAKHYRLEVERVGPEIAQLVREFGQESLCPYFLEEGELSAKLSVSQDHWNLEEILAKNLFLRSSNLQLHCREGGGSVCSDAADFTVEEGSFIWRDWVAEQLSGHCQIKEGLIQKLEGTGQFNGLDISASCTGCLDKIQADLRVRGALPEGSFCKKGPIESVWTLEGTWQQFSAHGIALLGCMGKAELRAEVQEGILQTLSLEAEEVQLEDLFEDFSGPARMRADYRGGSCKVEASWGIFEDCHCDLIFDPVDGFVECKDFLGQLALGSARFPLRGVECKKEEDKWSFDLRVERPTWDLLRLKGSLTPREGHWEIALDERSHLLGSQLDIPVCTFLSNGSLQTLQLAHRVSWPQILALAGSLGYTVTEPLSGELVLDIDLGKELSKIECRGENLLWKGQSVPFVLRAVGNRENWEIEQFRALSLQGSVKFTKEEKRWKIHTGVCEGEGWQTQCDGYFAPSTQKCELSLAHLHASTPLEGSVEGSGYLTIAWEEGLVWEVDLDLLPSPLKNGAFLIQNAGPIQLHYSNRTGLLLSGLNATLQKLEGDFPLAYGQAGLVQFDLATNHWLLRHCHLRLLADFFPMLQKMLGERFSFIYSNNLELSADLEFAADGSELHFFSRECFFPLFGAVRHLQNVDLNWDGEMISTSFLTLHQGHSLKIHTSFHPESGLGTCELEDEEHSLQAEERPLCISWKMDPAVGLSLHSIDGSFGGIEASFHEELAGDQGSLIGSARLAFGPLSELLPPRIGKVFEKLKMNHGYELKGRLVYDHKDLTSLSFKGLFSGKACELFGFQVRTLLSQLEADAKHVRLFEIKASDSAGILKIPELLLMEKQEWEISMPELTLQEFRPSLLQKVGHEVGAVGPLVIRELKMRDFKGLLEETDSYTAKGDLSFINSFKREHTVFDLPSDFLGRIFGLDLELLIPVVGRLTFDLKNEHFWLKDLSDAYSEGKRSKFFLVKEGTPSIDLDGHLNILIKMKQYVLFKFTEHFLLSIDGSLEKPSYRLQKKSRFLGT